MLNLNQLKIRTKLRIMSLVALLSIAALGFVSNYSFQTSKLLSIVFNAERVHNNTFQMGVEHFYNSSLFENHQLLDSAVFQINAANKMTYNFAIVDQILQLPEKERIDILYDTYKECFNYDRDNAYLMSSRIKLFLAVNNSRIKEAQQITMKGYLLGEKIKKQIMAQKEGKIEVSTELALDLGNMRNFYNDFAKIFASVNDYATNMLFAVMFLIVIILLIVLLVIGNLITNSIVEPVQMLIENFRMVALGNLDSEMTFQANNEIGQLAASSVKIQEGLREVVEHTKKVAEGDYDQIFTPRSKGDALSIALNIMVSKLKEASTKAKHDSWFKSGINSINEVLGGDHNLTDLSSKSLDFMMGFLHAQLGSIHLYNSEYQYLKLLSASGFDPKKLKERIKINEGILGQVAAKKTIAIVNDVPADSYLTFSSSGTYLPGQIVVAPLVFNETLVGVLELSSIAKYTELEINFIKQAADIIAINISSTINLTRTNELLLKTQEQASELQVQQEELRVANEELTEHTKVLTESEKRLQVQQEELRVANEELEERTRQLEIQKEDISHKNRELTETKDKLEFNAKELQQSSQYKSEFLANMSHELRTPLNSLLILSNLLSHNKKGNLTPDQVQSAKIIYKSGTDLLYLINEVLDLSKIEAGKMTFEFGLVNSSDIREEILAGFTATAEDKNLIFEVVTELGFPDQIETDRYRLMQIIKNLLSNAFKFTSTGKIRVDLMLPPPTVNFTAQVLNKLNCCCIKVEDSGVGIPAEKLEAIFEAFQQADGSISRKFGGTGLGLSISRELIKMLGGEIQLESVVGKGSSFYVYIPVRQVEKSINENPGFQGNIPINPLLNVGLAVEAGAGNIKNLPHFLDDDRFEPASNRTVLIIHSSKQQAEKYMQQVRAKNYRVIVAASIVDGVLLAEEFNPKAILLAGDLANNKANYELLKSHALISKLPVHIITPIEYHGSKEEDELKTLETIEFADALKSLESDFLSPAQRILVVEDDIPTRKIVRDLLSDLNLYIEEVGFAEDAFKVMSKGNFDCIILDLGLPDYSGKELLEKLKANKISIPKVIVYTGKELTKEEHRVLTAYTNAIILKGLKSDERLMDEVTLFLHQVSKTIPEEKIKMLSDEEDILFKGKKILVVDDEIRNVFALGKILEEREIEVFEAENGEVAIAMLKENKEIDLVLMDVMMPVMNGYEAMKVIRKTTEIKNVPIICLTAKAMKEDYENALKNGANDYLSKPVNEDKLFAMLKIWLYKK